ncbi:MAG TPA: sigma-54 dependent transcriptional regulator [Smithellaceae bacterium]|nr:MAG: Nif-specific regulatory protein [Deltaproteobacteria bacterium ADurb.BinA014]HNV65468.1 sigma-54 dependent transcriptional regulator [Smithellaceae bacterium]HNZ32158.1 sigma-54 dependent transcriptional regulator [Smithellaceae bacterium]
MKQKQYYINLYILIPLIFTGLSIIGIILTCQLSNYVPRHGNVSFLGLPGLIAVIGVLTFLVSLLIVRNILKPMMRFIEKTKNTPLFRDKVAENKKHVMDDVKEIEKVFDNVANILTLVEARELFPNVIGSSPAMRNIFKQITKVAPTDSTVLIYGESGTGKELIAQSIYEQSARVGKPFIKINCVAIPEGLLESELFGHEKGSFTGAVAQKKGKFELADGGTIFLDEIGDMPMATQAKLLRVLQEKEFERVGGNVSIRVDVRFIAATNKDLPKLIKKGKFREDLYFRINVFSIVLPPLRDRREDIPLLASFFLSKQEKNVTLSSEALQLLIGYAWPGNIRELKNVIEQASVLAEKDIIEPNHLPGALTGQTPKIDIFSNGNDINLDEKLAIMEKEMIIHALKKSGGIQVKAAEILKINQRSLWHRIKKYHIDIDNVKHLQ